MLLVGPLGEPDKYQLIELRSRGGEGEVWRGSLRVEGVDVPVAVKSILPEHGNDPGALRDRWSRQAEVLRSLAHPGLVRVREFFEGALPHEPGQADPSTTTLYLTMNWVEGPTLNEWVSRGPARDASQTIEVLGRLASAVDYLHSGGAEGVVTLHRDIKPTNVIVTDHVPVLVDFGFVRGVSTGPSGSIVGTPNFIAPEVAAGLGASPASDRYALGATAFFALTGSLPDVSNLPGLYAALDRVPELQGRQDLQMHILSMMNPDPRFRPSSATDWIYGMTSMTVARSYDPAGATPPPAPGKQAAIPISMPPTPTPAAVPPSPPGGGEQPVSTRPRRSRKLLVGSVLGVIVIAGGVVAASQLGLLSPRPVDEPQVAVEEPPAEPLIEEVVDEEVVVEEEEEVEDELLVAIEMPDLVGIDVDEALALLEPAGVTVSITDQDRAGDANVVLDQSPARGAELQEGDSANLTVSRAVPMLDAVGMELSEVRDWAGTYGARVESQLRFSRSVAADLVLEQAVPAGAALPEVVEFVIAEGARALFLEKLPTVASSGSVSSGVRTDMNGQVFLRSLTGQLSNRTCSRNPCVSASVEHNLSRDFDALVATVGYQDDFPSDGRVRMEVFADGEKVWERDIGLGAEVDLDLDVTDVLRLRIEWTLLGGSSGKVGLGEVQLLGDPAVIERYEAAAESD